MIKPIEKCGEEVLHLGSAPLIVGGKTMLSLTRDKIQSGLGVTKGNMKEYESAGACSYGFGSDIVRKDAINDGNREIIEQSARSYVEIAKQ
ncbi:MAG: hypothetical protein IKY33_03930 [Clostridia bacterium]|nr:hypothetical protein [Clostridia bacterium]